MKNFVQCGHTVTIAAPYDRLSGEGCLLGTLFGVACFTALSAATLEIDTEGVFALAKAGSQAWATLGLAIYWDDSAKVCTTTSGGNTKIGVNTIVVAGGAGDTVGSVRLNGSF